jgi:hypothetical protein
MNGGSRGLSWRMFGGGIQDGSVYFAVMEGPVVLTKGRLGCIPGTSQYVFRIDLTPNAS